MSRATSAKSKNDPGLGHFEILSVGLLAVVHLLTCVYLFMFGIAGDWDAIETGNAPTMLKEVGPLICSILTFPGWLFGSLVPSWVPLRFVALLYVANSLFWAWAIVSISRRFRESRLGKMSKGSP